ncbi:uncharacterized protein ACLA_018460 [Aspergillus clavatus NRRL 1]|uniref:CorA family metal ion transporter n=1 Tax=Aspergillus clavatus (strain ATCC 1007 / CBS 513.65 / DSM 816 / NCTC 3887 / NRRL 1 / QM 1276 / 107) TaxID=344612 RepID=A1CNC1_ASPCL|nr:uncharacterized protein ACLA_018460 [Aspergillus clavatus NRRL 1]EAW07142.1 hypothetical protein ACLA_018460 [Aspergillus clavatus NRRL 1]
MLYGTTAEDYDAEDHPEIELCSSVSQLIHHYLPENMECVLKDKIYGALHAILEDCQASPDVKIDEMPLFNKTVSKLLDLSNSIRIGMHGAEDRVPLLESHMDSLEELCYAISGMHSFLQDAVRDKDYSSGSTASAPVSLSSDPAPTTVLSDDGLSTGSDGSRSSVADLEGGGKSVSSRSSHDLTHSDPEQWSEFDKGKGWPDLEEEERHRNIVLKDFQKVERCLKLCKLSIICLLGETKPLLGYDDYLAVRPTRIASSILEHASRGLRDPSTEIPMRLDQVYQDYHSQLSLKVRDKPSRALLVELDLFEEELDSILKIIQKQQRRMEEFMSLAREIEQSSPRDSVHVLQNALRDLDEKKAMYQELNSSIEKLRRRVVRQIDLRQDNNSKAILVFTIVTLIFLPMSFITSYFGMNTVDIRDMDLGQSVFWAVAAPFTTLTVGVCMLIAYQGDRLREAVIQALVGSQKGRGALR